MEGIATKRVTMKSQLSDIILDITWSKVAKKYFGKSAGWFFQKMNGINNYDKEIEFTEEEKEQLKNGLLDLASRIALTAEKIK